MSAEATDPGSIFFVIDALGGANVSIATPPGLSGSIALQAAANGGMGYLGLAGSNGLHVSL